MGLLGDILVVDDERSMRDFLRIALERLGHRVETADSPSAAQKARRARTFDLVITDLKMPSGSGLDVLDQVKREQPETQVIVVTAFATPETAIAAMRRGAYDYLHKPFKLEEISVVVERALERAALVRDNRALRAELKERFRLDSMVGKSPAMLQLFELIRKVAPTRASVLVTGESGTGKEMVARALHQLSGPRATGPFVGVNCGAIPEALLESELFGHLKGSFTGATATRAGLFSAAHGGTLFLDEVSELSTAMQVKLLRALQERRIKPVGGDTEEEVDVRVVAASNRDLEAEVDRGTFRRDLFYRLNVIGLYVPPLRARREDIPMLVEHLLRKHAAAAGRPLSGVSGDALLALLDYDYPGNVRELENLIERAVTLESTDVVSRGSLPSLIPKSSPVAGPLAAAGAPQALSIPPEGIDLDQLLARVEREYVLQALERAHGVRKEAARLLGISFRSLRYRLAKIGLAEPEQGEQLSDTSSTEELD